MLIATDMVLQGSSRTQTLQIVEAIRQILDSAGWKAGAVNVGFQSCDDSTAQAGKWDPGKCSQNANAYAENQSLLAVIGTFNSGCAAVELPVLNQAAGRGLAMVSPANTYVCLTEGGPGVRRRRARPLLPDGHAQLRPRGRPRRVPGRGPGPVHAGAGDDEALHPQRQGGLRARGGDQRPGAAEHLGIEVVGFEAWDPRASNYEALMNQVKAGADGLFLGGLTEENGAQVIKDKVKVLGDNETVKLYMPDGFTQQSSIDESGVENTRGAFFSVAGVPIEEFGPAGQEFIDEFATRVGDQPVDPYGVYGAQAAQIVLEAIANSDYTRAGVIEQLFATEVTGGFLGDFSFNENGDPTLASGAVVGFTIFRGEEQLEVETSFSPDEEVVEAARGG